MFSLKTKATDFRNADLDLLAETQQFHVASLRYVWKLQCVGESIKFDFADSVAAFLDALFTSYLPDSAMYESIKPAIDEIRSSVQAANERISVTEQKAAQLKAVRKSVLDWRKSHCEEVILLLLVAVFSRVLHTGVPRRNGPELEAYTAA